MKRSVAAAAAAATTVLVPATAGAATLTTNQPCYIEQQPMTITGTAWPAPDWSVQTSQLFAAGTADAAGGFVTTTETAPIIPAGTTKPKTFELVGKAGTAVAARTTFQVVNFLVKPRNADGKPTGLTTWGFSGFLPGRPVYVHVRRGGRVWTAKAGKAKGPCGTLSARLRRLPAVPASQIRSGKYKIAVDNRKAYKKGGLQYPASVTIYTTFG